MIALDTNILVYARRREMPHHQAAVKLLQGLAEGDTPWALAWPCIYEYLRVITHPRVFDPPSPLEDALEDLDRLLESPSLLLLGEGPTHVAHMRRMVASASATGNLAHDAHIAALAVEHGVRELWTTDRDFDRFPDLRCLNPFAGDAVHERRSRYGARTRPVPRRRTARSRTSQR